MFHILSKTISYLTQPSVMVSFVLICFSCQSREKYFLTEQIRISELVKYESNFDSERKEVSSQLYVDYDKLPEEVIDDLSKRPLIFYRKDFLNNNKSIEVMYFFSKSDSIVKLITYTWSSHEVANSLEQLQAAEDLISLEDHKFQYNRIVEEINKELNQDIIPSKLISNYTPEEGTWKEASNSWKIEECTIDIKFIFSEGDFGTKSIRVWIYQDNNKS